YNFGNNLENLKNVEITSDIRFQRSLANHLPKKELDRSKVRDRISGNNSHNHEKGTSDDLSKYSQLKKRGLNDLDLYKNLYKHRYSKKNVLGKFDCYCEKKIFDKYDYICELAKRKKNEKKFLKKRILGRYGIPLILLALIPLFGFIFVMLVSGEKDKRESIIDFCTMDPTDTCNAIHVTKDNLNKLQNLGEAIQIISLYILPIIIVLFITYIFIKILKYEKLNSGKDKMT
ncbi:Protein of unknown function, putative, partial [Plasmodium vivax]